MSLVNITKRGSTAVLSMARAPVNSLSAQLLGDITAGLRECGNSADVDAVVLSSETPNVFCAGLDIMEFLRSENELQQFWTSVQDVFLTLYGFKKPVVAAVTGNAPAGGCWLATQCDYRVMVDDDSKVIGLNETQLGIVAPYWFAEPFQACVGQRQAELLLQRGALVPASHALKIGLVDELAPSPEAVVDQAVAAAEAFTRVPGPARHMTKMLFRGPLLERLTADREADTTNFLRFITSPPVRAAVSGYVESLGAKAKRK
jgi:3,2-trans-enoyl-CoA isomerase